MCCTANFTDGRTDLSFLKEFLHVFRGLLAVQAGVGEQLSHYKCVVNFPLKFTI